MTAGTGPSRDIRAGHSRGSRLTNAACGPSDTAQPFNYSLFVRDLWPPGPLRAQAAAGVIVGFLCVSGFAVLGMGSAVSMGVAAGILELVPVVGPLIAALIAVTQADGGVLPVLVFLGVLRILQDYVIYPRLVGNGMHMSIPAVILTVWAGAAMAGAGGVILAIPVAGLLSVSVRHWREYRDIEQLVRAKARDVAARQVDPPQQDAPADAAREE